MMKKEIEMKYIFMAILLIGMTACAASPQEPVLNEGEVYTAVVKQLYTVDDTFGGTLQPAKVYLVSQTDDGIGGFRIEKLPSASIDEATQQAITAGLAHLPAEFVWVHNREDVRLDPEDDSIEGGGAMITLGNIHPQDDGTVMVPGSIYVANLAAGGQTYILKQTESGWIVTDAIGAWMS